MKLNLITSVLIILTGAECSPWRSPPKLRSSLMHGVVNSRMLVTAAAISGSSVAVSSSNTGSSPNAESSSTSSSSSVGASALSPSDDVSRGGAVKAVGKVKLPKEDRSKESEDFKNARTAKEDVKSIKLDIVVEDKQRRKDVSSSKKIARKLKNRNSLNIRRKIFHASWGITFGVMNYFIPKKFFIPGMTCLTVSTLLMELLRYKKGFGWMNDVLHYTLGSSLRKHEMEGKFTGSFYFFTGVLSTALMYPRTCATIGIFQLALADPSASYFGRMTKNIYWSRIENGLGGIGRNKGILGFLGGALFCFPFNYQLLKSAKFAATPTTSSLLVASLALGLAGAFADLAVPTPALTLPKRILGRPVPPFHLDDNFVVPIFSGYAATRIFQKFGWNPDEIFLSKFVWL